LSNLLILNTGTILSYSSFGKDGRKQVSSYVPGPGAYELKESYVIEVLFFLIQKKPSFTMLSRRDIKENKIDVGPGQY
jgi:hypothetical protein